MCLRYLSMFMEWYRGWIKRFRKQQVLMHRFNTLKIAIFKFVTFITLSQTFWKEIHFLFTWFFLHMTTSYTNNLKQLNSNFIACPINNRINRRYHLIFLNRLGIMSVKHWLPIDYLIELFERFLFHLFWFRLLRLKHKLNHTSYGIWTLFIIPLHMNSSTMTNITSWK